MGNEVGFERGKGKKKKGREGPTRGRGVCCGLAVVDTLLGGGVGGNDRDKHGGQRSSMLKKADKNEGEGEPIR